MGKTTHSESKKLNIYLRTLRYVIPYTKNLIVSIFCAIMYSIFSGLSIYLVIPLLEALFSGKKQISISTPKPGYDGWFDGIKNSIDYFINHFIFSENQMDVLLRICLIVVVGFLGRNFFSYFQSYTMATVEQGLMMDIRNDLFKHIHNLYIGYFSNERSGNLISRVTNDVTVVNSGVSASFVTMIKEPVSILVFLFIAISISWKLTLISLLVFPFSLLFIGWIGLKLHKESGILQEKMADITSVLQETIFGAKIVKAFGMEDFENKKFQGETKKYFHTILKMTRIRNLSSPLTEFLSVAAGVIIIWYGGTQVLIDKTLGASEFLGFFVIIFQIMSPIKEISTVHNRIQEATAAGKRIFEILDMDPQIKNDPNPILLEKFSDSIQFKNVSFSYKDSYGNDKEVIVLKDLNLIVKKGDILAIVGPSGAGKSTLIDMIPRFYDPTIGKIFIDGFDLSKIEIKSIRSKIGIVTQETILFNDTIKNNIAYGLSDFSEEKVIEASIAANAHNFILETERGYDTFIGERGLKLSGGQRQRLSIARALLKNPPIMIFDEATSALDSESEILVQEAIERLMHNRTSIVIAHRLSTIRKANRIIVIDQGEIVEFGTHDELINNNSLYKKLYDLQFQI